MFIRRLYYDKQTNNIVLNYMARGEIKHTTVDEDFEFYAPLRGLDKANIGLIEWLEPNEDTENLFNTKAAKIEDGTLTFIEHEAAVEPSGQSEQDAEQAVVDSIMQEVSSYGY